MCPEAANQIQLYYVIIYTYYKLIECFKIALQFRTTQNLLYGIEHIAHNIDPP